MDRARLVVAVLAVVGAASASAGLYRVVTAQRRADRARAARERRSAILQESGPAGAVRGLQTADGKIAALFDQAAEVVVLESPGGEEIPRTSRFDYALLAVGILANTSATLLAAVLV